MSTTTRPSVQGDPSAGYADKVQMQHRLFAELSRMFGAEVPLYDSSLLVNRACNRAACAVLGELYRGFAISDEQFEKTSGERHGAIRIGREDEYRWVGRFFGQFAMEPHNFYDMTSVGAKSQPIIATAFRSAQGPEHRVFTSLLRTDWFDDATRTRIEALLAPRQVFSDQAKALIEKGERQGGLDWADAGALIAQGTGRIFKWTGRARDHALYKELCDAGFKIAADIACFSSHHLNHLTPNTLCMDLYTSAMKRCLGEIGDEAMRERAASALGALVKQADRDWMRLHFKHLGYDAVEALAHAPVSELRVGEIAGALCDTLGRGELDLSTYPHAGFKDLTEGPSVGTPVLLRQDAYKALTEPVEFTNPDASVVKTTHTARFGEIEQRFYATTPAGRAIYDACLNAGERVASDDPQLPRRDYREYQARLARAFEPIPKTLAELLDRGLVLGIYAPTSQGLRAKGTITTTDIRALCRQGYVRVEGLRYEDFLPVSAAGIFASNLQQYGTKSTARQRPTYTQAQLEAILGRRIIDTDAAYRGAQARSILACYAQLGLDDAAGAARLDELRAHAACAPGGV